MAEYIEREAIEFPYMTMSLWGLNADTCKAYNEGVKAAEDAVAAIPAADVVAVVRCEDCVSSGGDRFGELICQNQLCPCYGREVDHAFSCILGERREEDG